MTSKVPSRFVSWFHIFVHWEYYLVHNKDTTIVYYILHFQAGHPWFSILTRTGVFKGKENDADFPADLVSV